MKKFFLEYGYSSVKMFVDQVAIALFGFSLVIAVAGLADSEPKYGWLTYAVSVFAVLFYLVIIYSVPWNHGAKDRVSVDYNKKSKNIFLGLYMGLVANIPNFIIFLLTALFTLVGSVSTAAGFKILGNALEGMYIGILQLKVGGVPLASFWWMSLVVTLPSIITSTVAYIAGYNNFRVFKFKEKRKYY